MRQISLLGEAHNAILTKISLYIDLKLLKLKENEGNWKFSLHQVVSHLGPISTSLPGEKIPHRNR